MLYKNIHLDRFQEEAVKAIEENLNIVVGAPTGAGKTLIAEYALEKAIRENKRIIYTAPIKALSNQKFRDFSNEYPDKIGILTGDVSINSFANAVIMTTEIFRNSILDEPTRFEDVSYVILDEVHFIDDEERGTVWEESIIFAPKHIKFLCLSATVTNIFQFANWMQEIRKSQVKVIIENHRPVPLKHFLVFNIPSYQNDDFRNISIIEYNNSPRKVAKYFYKIYSQRNFMKRKRHSNPSTNNLPNNSTQDLVKYLRQNRMLPVLWFAFSRKLCEELAQNLSRENFLDDDQRYKVTKYFDDLCEKFSLISNPQITSIRKIVRNGVCYHHAGLLPTLKEIIERLFTTGYIKILFATETFALGVNMPARSVVLNTLHKYDGVRHSMLAAREFQQMTGRAGRRGIDNIGYSFSIIDHKCINHNVAKIISGTPEPLTSQFNMSYSTILNLIKHLGKKVYEAWEKSFGFFLMEKFDKKLNRHKTTNYLLEQLKRRIEVLKSLKYINNWDTTEKGAFASFLYAYELQLSELYFGRILDELIPEQLAVMICAVVYKSKRKDWSANLPRFVLGRIKNLSLDKISYILAVERTFHIKTSIRQLDFGLGKAIYEWCLGKSFEEIKANTSISDGDIVRNFRIVVQVARLLIKATEKISKEPPDAKQSRFISRLCQTIRIINRDEVDAEKQLRTRI